MDNSIAKLCDGMQKLSPHHSDDEDLSESVSFGVEDRTYEGRGHANIETGRIRSPTGSDHQVSREADLTRARPNGSRQRQMHDPNSIFEIRFKCTKDNYRLAPSCAPDLMVDDLVVVEADRGFDAGIVHAIHPPPVSLSPYLPSPTSSLRHILCRASEEDHELVEQNHREEERALQLCRHLAVVRHVPIVVAATEMQFDRKKLTIIFSSDRRVDFRELVRDVFQVFKTRIWMQKVSPAEAASLSYMFPTAPIATSPALPLPQARSSRPVYTSPLGHEERDHFMPPPQGHRGGSGGYDQYRGYGGYDQPRGAVGYEGAGYPQAGSSGPFGYPPIRGGRGPAPPRGHPGATPAGYSMHPAAAAAMAGRAPASNSIYMSSVAALDSGYGRGGAYDSDRYAQRMQPQQTGGSRPRHEGQRVHSSLSAESNEWCPTAPVSSSKSLGMGGDDFGEGDFSFSDYAGAELGAHTYDSYSYGSASHKY